MVRSLLLFCLLCIGLGCKKKDLSSPNVIFIASNTTDNLNAVVRLDQRIFICGGQRYNKSAIYQLDLLNNILSPCTLDTNSLQKELYDIISTPDHDLIAVGYNGAIHISSDSGTHWKYIQNQSWRECQSVASLPGDSLLIIGGIAFADGFVLPLSKSNLASSNITAFKAELADIKQTSTQTYIMCGYGTILRSEDAGKSWQYTNAKNDFFKASAWKDSLFGIAVGNSGGIVRTENGGKDWRIVRRSNMLLDNVAFRDVAYADNGFAIAVGENGRCFSSIDNGMQWTRIQQFTDKNLHAVIHLFDQKWLIAGEQGGLWILQF